MALPPSNSPPWRRRTAQLLIWSVPLVLAAQPASAAPNSAKEGAIVLMHPERPSKGVLTRAASCGDTRYSVTIDSAGTNLEQVVRSIAVNGRKISALEKRKITAPLEPGTFVMDAFIVECSRSSPSAKLRLSTIYKPWGGNKERYLDFWVAGNGIVSGVAFN